MRGNKSCWSGNRPKPSEDQIRQCEQLRKTLGQDEISKPNYTKLNGQVKEHRVKLELYHIHQLQNAMRGEGAG